MRKKEYGKMLHFRYPDCAMHYMRIIVYIAEKSNTEKVNLRPSVQWMQPYFTVS